jgi:hypothetical protein
MINELDRVVLTKPIPRLALEPGDVGTVVLVHERAKGFDVEFTTLLGETYAVITVAGNDVRPIQSNDLAQARTIAGDREAR